MMSRMPPAPDLWGHVLPALAFYGVFIMILMPVTAMQTFSGVAHDESVFSQRAADQEHARPARPGARGDHRHGGQQWLTTRHYSTLHDTIHLNSPQFQDAHARFTAAIAASSDPVRAAELATAQIAQVLAQQSALLANLDHFRALAVVAVLAIVVSLTQKVIH